MTAPAQNRILKLRVDCGSEADPLLAQLRASTLLQGAQLHPPSVPPAAILCVRRVRDPLPGRVPLHAPAAAPPLEWQRALQSVLARHAEHAARPGRGDHEGNAQAVLFEDWAEALACFIRDWLDGKAGERWWWDGLFAETRPSLQFAIRRLVETPREIPAVIHKLTRANRAVEFLRRVQNTTLIELTRGLSECFASPDTFLELGFAVEHEVVTKRTVRSRLQEQSAAGNRVHSDPPLAASPWSGYVPDAAEGPLEPESRTLWIAALCLQRAPAHFLSEGFLASLKEWRRDAQAWLAAAASEPPAIAAVDSHVEAMGAMTALHRAGDALPAAEPARAGGDEASERASPRRETIESGAIESGTRFTVGAVYDRPRSPGSTSWAVTDRPYSREIAECESHFQLHPIESFETVETAYAGVFYLVNLALHWNIYGDFTRPQEPGLALPVWDFLTLLGTRLLDDPDPADPILALFAQLAGRDEHTPPGRGFQPPPVAYELDPELPSPQNPSVHEWFDWLAGCARKRLQLALNLGQGGSGGPGDSLSAILLEHRGRIHVTDSRLDVIFSLDSHPISIRIAGLDRDPGWIPAAGRSILFHYEAT